MTAVKVKICGVTNVEDALACIDAGADAMGINLIPSSARAVSLPEGQALARAVKGRILTVAVVADLPLAELKRLQEDFDCLQLHGTEPPEHLAPLLPHAYKAIRIASAEDVSLAAQYPGEHVLADAKVTGALGGTGQTFDWSLVRELAKVRKLTLAGGLTPDNVDRAVKAVSPYAVDVASGVELAGEPRRKDWARMRIFVARARA